MGFGYLLVGYIIAFVFSIAQVYFFQDIIGGVLMLIGLYKLAAHGKNFLRAVCADMGFILVCFVQAVLLLLGMYTEGGTVATILAVVKLLATLVLHFFTVAGMYYLSMAVELEKEPIKCRHSLGMIVTYYPMYLIYYLLTPKLANFGNIGAIIGNIVTIAVTLYGAVVILYNIALIHSCYCRICLPSDARGEIPQSRFKWVNKYNEKTNALLDSAYSRKKKDPAPAEPQEPGFLRVKRKKKK